MRESRAFVRRGDRWLRLVAFAVSSGLVCASCADLAVRNVRHESFLTHTLMMKGTVVNQGSVPAGASTTTLATREGASGAFTPRTTVATPALDPGQEADLMLWPFPPTILHDPYPCLHVQVCADAGHAVHESDEGNNCTTRTFGSCTPGGT